MPLPNEEIGSIDVHVPIGVALVMLGGAIPVLPGNQVRLVDISIFVKVGCVGIGDLSPGVVESDVKIRTERVIVGKGPIVAEFG